MEMDKNTVSKHYKLTTPQPHISSIIFEKGRGNQYESQQT